jgi:hypothetical protein
MPLMTAWLIALSSTTSTHNVGFPDNPVSPRCEYQPPQPALAGLSFFLFEAIVPPGQGT